MVAWPPAGAWLALFLTGSGRGLPPSSAAQLEAASAAVGAEIVFFSTWFGFLPYVG